MDYYYYNGELYHHGITGQKWGVRNGPPYPLDSGSASKSNAKRKLDTGKVKSKVSSVKNKISESRSASKEKKETKKEVETEKKKNISEMSDAELQKVVNRMKLENKYYKEASDLEKNTAYKGKSYVDKAKNKLLDAAFDTATDKAVEKIKKGVSDLFENTNKDKKDKNDKKDKEDKGITIDDFKDVSSKYEIKNYKVASASPAKEFVDSLGKMNFASTYQTVSTSYNGNSNDTLNEMLKANNLEYKNKKKK